ncbi:unnamed protein product [Thlaspi arvense]|uniref:Uncharacterized protein n=1 Tax=Thlaspi arvense TaxID=13288 RepID=A0AAU9SIV1_THLAR|nr:unnamed protein product [Thlaspi arvense]
MSPPSLVWTWSAEGFNLLLMWRPSLLALGDAKGKSLDGAPFGVAVRSHRKCSCLLLLNSSLDSAT